MKYNLGVLALAALLWSCGAPAEGGAGDETDRSSYPSPPNGYGMKAGTVIADIGFQAEDGSPFSLGTIFADPHNRVLLLTTTAGWCTACIEEQPSLAGLHREFSGRGLAVVAAMFEDADFAPATLELVRSWKARYELPYTMVLDQEFLLGPYYNETLTPMNMVVDVDTMTILKVTTGFNPQQIRAVIEANLPL